MWCSRFTLYTGFIFLQNETWPESGLISVNLHFYVGNSILGEKCLTKAKRIFKFLGN